ncbi:MAG: preprotein translocase subunit SecG [Patescibacteria group bacterium]|jgi:preprotein translocase subunit SecG|nr:preprotein translocase subunit SecG [Patescibacteria group bacterium]
MIIDIIQIITAILLITVILIQNKGTGLGAAFGGESNVYRSKRGAEKGLFILTIILSIVFLVTALANALL